MRSDEKKHGFAALAAGVRRPSGPSLTAAARRRRRARRARRPDTFQKVTLNDRPGEPISLAVLPDLRVLHTARTGEVRIHDPAHRPQHARRRRPGLPARRGGPAGHRDRPGLPPQQLGLPLLLAAAGHPGRQPVHPGGQRGRRSDHRHRGRLRTVQGRPSAVPVQAARQHARPEHRAADHRRARSTAASAATSAARSTSTARATSTCPPVTTPTRSSPTATRRSTTAPTATPRSTPGAARATRTTCAASCCASG